MTMTKQIVWVVESGCKYEGGKTIAVTKYRTQARSIKSYLQRDEWFSHEVDYALFRKEEVIDRPVDRLNPWGREEDDGKEV